MTSRSDSRRDERGSIVLVMTVLMIITALSVAVLVRSIGMLNQQNAGESIDSALAVSDAAVAVALAAIDESILAGTGDTTLSGTATTTAGVAIWNATLELDGRWLITVNGEVNGFERTLQAYASRSSGFPYTLFSRQQLNLDASAGLAVQSIDTRTGSGTPTANAVLVADRGMRLIGATAFGDAQQINAPYGFCSGPGCHNVISVDAAPVLDPPAEPTETQSCTADGTLMGTLNGQDGIAMVCDRDVVFVGSVNVVNAPFTVHGTAGHSVTMIGALVNDGGAPGDLVVQLAGDGFVDLGDGTSPTFYTGVLYAPLAELRGTGSLHLVGSVVFDRFNTPGPLSGSITYDDALRDLPIGSWRLSDWHAG